MAGWIVVVGFLTKLVLLLLISLSVWSVSLMRKKSIELRFATEKLPQEFQWFLASLKNQKTENVERLSRGFFLDHRSQLEQGLGYLSTLGSNAPFVGLFGTVLGIIQSFGVLSNSAQSDGVNTVMAGISEALIATAIGLLVAIPAVVTFNLYSRKIRDLFSKLDSIKEKFLAAKDGV
jgi:biopolymer transport protein ExbB/TolQ